MHMTGVKTQTHKSSDSQFLAETWSGFPVWPLKQPSWKPCFSSYWSQWQSAGMMLVVAGCWWSSTEENGLSERVVHCSSRFWLPVVQRWTSGQLTLLRLGCTQLLFLLPLFNSASWLRHFKLNRLKGSAEYKINDLEPEGDYKEMAWRK